MVSSGRSQHRLALFTLLLVHTAAAARLNVGVSVKQVGNFDVLTAIQTEVDTMNTNLEKLSTAIDGSSAPTQEPSPSSPTDEPPSPTGEHPSLNVNSADDNKLRGLFISKNFLTLESDARDAECDAYQDVETTLNDAQENLNLVSEQQLSNSTLAGLRKSNVDLTSTISCVNGGSITLASDAKEAVKKAISATETAGKEASDIIDNIVAPPTPAAPEDDSGFKSATIALGVLLSLAVVAVAGLAVVVRRRQSSG